MLNQLHNEIDRLEEIRNRAKETARKAVVDNLRPALEASGQDIAKAMILLAQIVEDEITDLTTEAFHMGVGFARERAKVPRG